MSIFKYLNGILSEYDNLAAENANLKKNVEELRWAVSRAERAEREEKAAIKNWLDLEKENTRLRDEIAAIRLDRCDFWRRVDGFPAECILAKNYHIQKKKKKQ